MDTSKKKKSIKQRAKKAIVTQDNRFIYAKYDMNANELKFFMWIVAQLNSQKDSLFQVCEIPLSEVMQVWQWKDTSEGYKYTRDLCYSMARKAYVEDFKLLDEKTMKEKSVFQAMPLFKFIRYQEGQGFISYQLNDSLMQYLLDLKRDFTQIKFDDIQQMKSAYSIRIYNMLVCELKQNKQSLKINLSALQNILEVPKSLMIWDNFKQKVLAQAKKDINTKSNLVLLDIKTFKTGRKITDLEFIFDYKNNDKRIKREQEKEQSFYNELIKIIQEYIGKSIYQKRFGEMIIISYQFDEEKKDLKLIAKRKADDKFVHFGVKSFKDINALKKAKDKAEELFYLDEVKVLKSKEAQNKYRSLFD
ncbi:replication initiation protein [Campylobacter sp. MIT 19-121]|uniref:replication initiation protein n=1 Tax=Campylobacter sp. MIT 19-121 TaxID=2703906 RepID=UPI00138A298C|nr:replication initiation protein [Campylobacter sp. MIT 19-121]NDJ28179.1 replication initiation protein [Campylobacter sp. MIT 19-121]